MKRAIMTLRFRSAERDGMLNWTRSMTMLVLATAATGAAANDGAPERRRDQFGTDFSYLSTSIPAMDGSLLLLR
jgi:hypothetical protein